MGFMESPDGCLVTCCRCRLAGPTNENAMMRNAALWSTIIEMLLFACYGVSVMYFGRDEGSALFTLEEPVDDACVLVSWPASLSEARWQREW